MVKKIQAKKKKKKKKKEKKKQKHLATFFFFFFFFLLLYTLLIVGDPNLSTLIGRESVMFLVNIRGYTLSAQKVTSRIEFFFSHS